MDDKALKRLSSRKFILVLLVFATATALCAMRIIDQTGWVTVTLTLLGGYFTVNYAQKKDETAAATQVAVAQAQQTGTLG